MESLERIISLVKKVVRNELPLERAKEQLYSEELSPLLKEVACQLNMGAGELRFQRPQAAYTLSLLSYVLSKITANEELVAHCSSTLGFILLDIGKYDESVTLLNQALNYFEEKKDKQAIASVLGNFGLARWYLGNHREALEHQERALNLFQEVGDKEGETKTLNNLGLAYWSLGDYRKSISCYEQCQRMSGKLRDKQRMAPATGNLGISYQCLGEYSRAIEYYQQALELYREEGNRKGEAGCLNNLGTTYRSLGDYGKALGLFEQASEICKEIENPAGMAFTFTNIGMTHWLAGDYSKATDFCQQSLDIFKHIGNLKGEEDSLGNLGLVNLEKGDYDEAIRYFKTTIEIANQIEDSRGAAIHLGNLGLAYWRRGELNEAISCFSRALRVSEQLGSVDIERMALYNTGRIYDKALGKKDLAYSYYRDCIRIAEETREDIKQEEHRIGYFEGIESAYKYMILLCNQMRNDQPARLIESFEYVERSKGRTFLDCLGHTFLKAPEEIPKALILRENDLLRDRQFLYLERGKQGVGTLVQIQKLELELAAVWDEMAKIDPEYVSMRRSKPLNFTEIQSLIKSQGPGFCLVEYFHSPDADKLLIFILRSSDGKLEVEEVNLPLSTFRYYMRQYMDETSQAFTNTSQIWQNLSNYVITPIMKYLDGVHTLYFVPDGALHYLPFHALRHNGEYLIRNYKIAFSPSASVIRYCQRKRKDKRQTCLSLGVVFEEEAWWVAEIFRGNSIFRKGSEVTKDLVREESKGKDILHFSCHGRFHFDTPMKSGLELAQGEVLTVEEIFQLKLNADLVTLSACETGLSKRESGDDLIGLTRSFIYAGTPSVVVSLWDIPQASTLELMKKFYWYLKDGKTKVEALQKAQLDIMNHPDHPEWRHPYYWAPFILVGDWK